MINKARLEKLLVALEGVKPRDFDMNNYVHSCGTPSCVLGYFASRTDLQAKFALTKDRWGSTFCALRGSDDCVDYDDPEVRKYFGIDSAQAEHLFGAGPENEDATPAIMRRKIRKFIDKNGAM